MGAGHAVCAPAHAVTQVPAVQRSVSAQVRPQAPQLPGSTEVDTQMPPHSVCPGPQRETSAGMSGGASMLVSMPMSLSPRSFTTVASGKPPTTDLVDSLQPKSAAPMSRAAA